MKRLLFILNPASGKTQIKTYLMDIIDIVVKAGYSVEIYTTQSSGDAKEYIISHPVDYDLLVCSGGDGTLNETVSGLMQFDPEIRRPLGYIPAGTTNDFASSLNIPKKPDKAADFIVEGSPMRIDVGQFGEKHFIYVAAFGAFSDVSYETPRDLKNLLGHQAYILNGIKEIPQIKPYHIKVHANGLPEDIEGDFIYGMITNSKSVGGFKNITGKNIDLSDGMFEVTLVRTIKTIIDLNNTVGYLTGTIEKTDAVVTFKTSAIEVTAEGGLAWCIDGEYGGTMETIGIENINNAISIMQKEG